MVGKKVVAVAVLSVGATLVVAPHAQAAGETKTAISIPVKALHPDKNDLISGTFSATDPGTGGALALPVDVTISVSREVDGTVTQLPPVVANPLGQFRFRDTGGGTPLHTVTYTLSWPGAVGYLPAESTATFRFLGRPWDFDSDGYADLAVAAPGETVAGHAGAGSVTVVPGGPAGPTGAGSTIWTQNSPGVPGGAEKNDDFGYALTSGDYDGDGYADLAISAPGEDASGKADFGYVAVIRGSASGLNTSYSPTAPNTPAANKFTGEALASADVNGDGRDDLMVGMPGVRKVAVYRGTSTGADLLGKVFDESIVGGRPGKKTSSGFGQAMAAGDFNNDGYGDIAVGAPYDYYAHGYSTGVVVVASGSASGVGPSVIGPTGRRWNAAIGPDSPGLLGTHHLFGPNDSSDYFGGLLAAGDLNGDGYDDLAIGAPGVPVTTDGVTHEDAGEVHVVFGGKKTVTTAGNLLFSMDTSGVPGRTTKSGGFGRSLAIGRDRDSGKATLAVGSFLDSVTLLPGADAANAVKITQETPGVPGGTETDDDFGSFLRFASYFGATEQDLGITATWENDGGAVTVLPSTSTGVTPTAGSIFLTQESPGIPGSSAKYDLWGWLSDSH